MPAAETGVMPDIALQIASLPKENKKRPNRIVIITQGKDDVVVVQGNIFIFSIHLALMFILFLFFLDGKVTLYPAIIVPSEKIVDTNGAGDAFVGGDYNDIK